MNDLISVIVPIYNIEKYLKRCIDSIINQSYSNIEIILVDDGSNDKCPIICDNYLKSDKRITVIHKENGGLSDARNIGIKKSNGQYITFIDSDDFIHTNYIKELYETLIKTKSDISCCDFYNFPETDIMVDPSDDIKNNDINAEKILVVEKIEALERMMYRNILRNSACAKLFKKNLFTNILFPKGKLCEDLGTMYKLFDLANCVSVSHKKYYYYMQRKHSIIHSNFNINRMDGLYFAIDETAFVKEKYPQIVNAAYNREFMEAIYILIKIPYKKNYNNQLDEIHNSIKKTRKKILIDKKSSPKVKILAFISFFGLFILKKIVSLKKYD